MENLRDKFNENSLFIFDADETGISSDSITSIAVYFF